MRNSALYILSNHITVNLQSSHITMTTFSESAIEPYCELAKNSSGQKTVQVVLDALSDPNTFVFSELIEVDSVQKVYSFQF